MLRSFNYTFRLSLVYLVFGVLPFLAPVLGQAHFYSADLKEIRTEHFRIIYDAPQQPVAKLYAVYAEQAWLALEPLFKEAPETVTILINDNTDNANAFATSLPFPFINIYPVFPSHLDSVSDYGNWAYELVLHELGHIFIFEPTNGVFTPLRYIFGSVARPNFLLPRWYHEGLCVNLETIYSNGGRLRSPDYLANIRAMVLDNTLREENMARINEAIPDWPGGLRPYMFGGVLLNDVLKKAGTPEIFYDLNQSYSRRIPYLLNTPIEDKVEQSYSELLNGVFTKFEDLTAEQTKIISAMGTKKGGRLRQPGYTNHSPRFSPNGQYLAYVGKTDNIGSFIRVLKEKKKTEFRRTMGKTVFEGSRISRVEWFPDNKHILYDDTGTWDRSYNFSDLYKIDIFSEKVTRLTRGKRASEASISTDGKIIAFRENYTFGTRISMVDSEGKNFKVLYEPPRTHRVSHPEFLSESRLLFVERDTEKNEVIKLINLKNTDENALPITILEQYSPVAYPRRTAMGIVFQSTKSGVPNLYLADARLTSARAITNTVTSVNNGDIHPLSKNLYFSQRTGRGDLIHTLKFAQWNVLPRRLPEVKNISDYEFAPYTRPNVQVDTTEHSYSPWGYLLPRYWIPFIFAVDEGYLFQAITGASDPAGLHSYNLQASYDTLTEKVGFSANYTNNQTPISQSILGGVFYEYLYTGDLVRENETASYFASGYIPSFSNNWRWGLGAVHNKISFNTGNAELTRSGPTVSISYSKVTQKGKDITPSKGKGFRLGYTRYLEEWGNITYDSTSLSTSLYLSSFLPSRHGISLTTNSIWAPNNNIPALGSSTTGGNYQATLVGSGNLMRGYPSGVFLGKTLSTANLEYRFPITWVYDGFGTLPAFLRKIHGALFFDVVTLDGLFFDQDIGTFRSTKYGNMFYGSGLELRFDLTLGYGLPARINLGLYYGLDERPGGGFSPFVSFTF